MPLYFKVIGYDFFPFIHVSLAFVRFKQEFIFIFKLPVFFVQIIVTFGLSFP